MKRVTAALTISLLFAPGTGAAAAPPPESPVAVRVASEQSISTKTARPGDAVRFRTTQDVELAGQTVPAGSLASGTILRAKRAGRFRGEAELVLGRMTIHAPDGGVLAASEDPITIIAPKKMRSRQPASEARVRGLIMLGMAAGYLGAWAASSVSDSEEGVAGTGVAVGAATIALIQMRPRGQDAQIGRGAMMTMFFVEPGR